MGASTINVKQGDFGPDATLAFILTDPNGILTSLAGKTLVLNVWGDPASPIISATCVFDGGMQCHYIPAQNDFLDPGIYQWELEIESVAPGRLSGTTGKLIIWPSPIH